MKFTTSAIGTLAVLGAAVMAQAPSTLPDCGQTCINNLLADAANFGCTGGSSDEGACLCSNATFTYGIRDCSNESCPDDASAASVISYGIDYCSSAGVAIPTTIVSVTSGTIVPTVTSGTGGSSVGSGSAITTSSFTSTVTSDGTTLTTTGATTIFGGGAADSATSSGGSIISSAEASASSVLSSVSGSVSSALSSATSAAGSAVSSATDTSSSSAFAPHMTAAPVSFLAAAAGVAALLL